MNKISGILTTIFTGTATYLVARACLNTAERDALEQARELHFVMSKLLQRVQAANEQQDSLTQLHNALVRQQRLFT